MRNKKLKKTLKEIPLKSKIKVNIFILFTKIKDFFKIDKVMIRRY